MNDILFQLYSARHTPLADALKIVADSSYTGVEAYGDNLADLHYFQSVLTDHGLKCPSVHVALHELRTRLPQMLDTLGQLGVEQVVCPYLSVQNRPKNKSGWQALAEELAGYASLLNSHGLLFAWHNHDFEFIGTADGVLPMRVLLDTAIAMQWEIDLGWVHRASESPDSWLRTYGDRVSAVHFKDVAPAGECADEDGWADVGHGVLDWPSIVHELKILSPTLNIVEHDNPTDVQRFARRSIKTIQGWDLT